MADNNTPNLSALATDARSWAQDESKAGHSATAHSLADYADALDLCLEREEMLAEAKAAIERLQGLLTQHGPNDIHKWEGYKVGSRVLARLSGSGRE